MPGRQQILRRHICFPKLPLPKPPQPSNWTVFELTKMHRWRRLVPNTLILTIRTALTLMQSDTGTRTRKDTSVLAVGASK